jgi:hypothetical protein
VSDPVRFLAAFSQALSTVGLYGDEHPATIRAVAGALERLHELQGASPQLQFTFLLGEVLYGSETVPELEGWEWSSRFIKAGVERIEFTEEVQPDQFGRFLSHLAIRLGMRNGSTSDLWQIGESPIRFGQVTLGQSAGQAKEPQLPVVTLSYSLREEQETVDWMHHEVQGGAKLPIVEADAVVRSLSIAMHAEQAMVLPLLQLKEFDQYTTTHSMNVAVLAMALGEYLELGGTTVRALGVAGLLHDLGKVCIPRASSPRLSGKWSRSTRWWEPVCCWRVLIRWTWQPSSPTSTTSCLMGEGIPGCTMPGAPNMPAGWFTSVTCTMRSAPIGLIGWRGSRSVPWLSSRVGQDSNSTPRLRDRLRR